MDVQDGRVGRGFEKTSPMPEGFTRTDAWDWAALRARDQQVLPPEIPFVLPDYTDREVLVQHPAEQITWFISGWRVSPGS